MARQAGLEFGAWNLEFRSIISQKILKPKNYFP